ncbi:conserved hypothetical protein [Trichinella spiralis]|uniref:hypothetical protein n=1 Tax=Trichinella spiralis TaxID=6334 RepID=UPI0001EFC567|nr:conserved hypothetical protein [Trichinella spiralis]
MKTVPQIYHEEASSASVDLETAEENLSILSEHFVWCMDGTFKIVPEWYQQMFTIHVFIAGKLVPLAYCLTVHKDLYMYREIFDNLILKAAALGVVLHPQKVICDFETALIPALQGTFPGVNIQGCYFHFCQAVMRKVTELGIAEWMSPDRLPLWNVYNVNIRTNNDLEDWHFKMNRLAGKRHLGFYELLQLLIDEQVSTETLIQHVISGRVTASDLQIKNKKYEELQQRITALTAEYSGGTRTLEQFLRAVAYLVPEAENY